MTRRLIAGAAALLLTAGSALAQTPDAAPLSGKDQFEATCSACHQVTGLGIPGAFPALAGNVFVQGDERAVVSTVLNGRGGMPTFKADLSDAQIAAILTYVRSAWGNKAAPVTPATVAAVRAQLAPPKPAGLQAH